MPQPTLRGTVRAIRVLWRIHRWQPYTPDMVVLTAADPATGFVEVYIQLRGTFALATIGPKFPAALIHDALDDLANALGESGRDAGRLTPARHGRHPCGHWRAGGVRPVRADRP